MSKRRAEKLKKNQDQAEKEIEIFIANLKKNRYNLQMEINKLTDLINALELLRG